MLYIVISLAVTIALLSAFIVWMAYRMKKNIEVQAKVTSEMLKEQAEDHSKLFRKQMMRHQKCQQHNAALIHDIVEQKELISSLETSIELLNAEINRLEEINELEHGIKKTL